MSFSRARQLALNWGSDLIDMGYTGHINVAAGFGPWPQGKQLRDDLALRSTPGTRPAKAPFHQRTAP